MVYYDLKAIETLNSIFYGLLVWSKHPLSKSHAKLYVDDIFAECEKLNQKSKHLKCRYSSHSFYGEFAHRI